MTHDNLYKQVARQLSDYLLTKGKRLSVERQKVLQYFCGDRHQWTAVQLVERAVEDNISRATVYNVLRLLEQAQVVRFVRQSENSKTVVYELNVAQHNSLQMVCTRCQRIVELKDAAIADLVSQKKYANFRMNSFVLTVYGECKVCRKKKS